MVKNKTNATSPSGNAIVDSKSTDATVRKGNANVSFAGNETSCGKGEIIKSKAPGVHESIGSVIATTFSGTAIAANYFTANATGVDGNASTSVGKVKDTEVGRSAVTANIFHGGNKLSIESRVKVVSNSTPPTGTAIAHRNVADVTGVGSNVFDTDGGGRGGSKDIIIVDAVTTSPSGTAIVCSIAADATGGVGNVGATKGGSGGSHDVNMNGAVTTSPTGTAIACTNAADATGGVGNVGATKRRRGGSHDVNMAVAVTTRVAFL